MNISMSLCYYPTYLNTQSPDVLSSQRFLLSDSESSASLCAFLLTLSFLHHFSSRDLHQLLRSLLCVCVNLYVPVCVRAVVLCGVNGLQDPQGCISNVLTEKQSHD